MSGAFQQLPEISTIVLTESNQTINNNKTFTDNTIIQNWIKRTLPTQDLTDNVNFVVLLHPAVYTGASLGLNYCIGKLFLGRGNSEAYNIWSTIDIKSQSAYQTNNASLEIDIGNNSGSNINFDLVTCSYQDIFWLAIRCTGVVSFFGNTDDYSFEGLHKVISGESVALNVIGYYNTNTSTVINSEINNSIVPFTANTTKEFQGNIIINGTSLNNSADFHVGGSPGTFYPVLFTAKASSQLNYFAGRTRLQIYRTNVHLEGTESDFVGTFDLVFAFIPSNYGNNISAILDVNYVTGEGAYADAVGDIQDCTQTSGSNEIAVWLRGGLTYSFKCPDAASSWVCTNPNSGGTSIVNSSGATLNPSSTQSALILGAKNKLIATPTEWTSITTFSNDFTPYPGTNFVYRKLQNGTVFINATLIRNDTNSVGDAFLITNLPSSIRPVYDSFTMCSLYTDQGGSSVRIDVRANGDIYMIGTPLAATTGITFLGISFSYLCV